MTDAVEQRQPAPLSDGRAGGAGSVGDRRRSDLAVVGFYRGNAAVEAGDALDEPEVADETATVRIGA